MGLVDFSFDGAIAFLTLNRPDARNALSPELCDAIVDALGEIDAAPTARALVLRGNGPAFCSGADFASVSGPGGPDFVVGFERMLEAVARHRLPVIAAVHGAALGGGLQLASACDFRVVAEDARLGIPSSRLGILVNFENVRRLVLLVGAAVAKEILMTGRVYSGAEAVGAGLAHRSVAAAELEEAATSLARHIARLAPLSVQGTKRAVQLVVDDLSDPRTARPDDAAEIDRLVVEAYASADLQEGIAAMRDKREPRFQGR